MRKRVAFLTNFVPPYRLPLLQNLTQRFEEFRIFISTPMEAGREWPADWANLPVHVQRTLSFRRSWVHPNNFTEAITVHFPYDTIPLLAQYRPDIIVSGEMGARTAQSAAYRMLARDVRLVLWTPLSEITEQGRGSIRPVVRRSLLKAADAVIVNGASGSRYIRRLGVDQSRIFRVPQTTEIAPFLSVPLAKTEDIRRRILISGRLIELKGLLPFFRHLSDWVILNPEDNVELWVAGDGPLRSQLEAFHTPPGLKIRFLGNIVYSKLPEVYAQCGMLAFPTLADEWGMVVVEAMAAGLPVLGSLYSQAVEDLISDGYNGWTFHPDQPDEVRSGIDRALRASADCLERMSQRVREDIRHSTPAVMADNIISAIEHAQSCPIEWRQIAS